MDRDQTALSLSLSLSFEVHRNPRFCRQQILVVTDSPSWNDGSPERIGRTPDKLIRCTFRWGWISHDVIRSVVVVDVYWFAVGSNPKCLLELLQFDGISWYLLWCVCTRLPQLERESMGRGPNWQTTPIAATTRKTYRWARIETILQRAVLTIYSIREEWLVHRMCVTQFRVVPCPCVCVCLRVVLVDGSKDGPCVCVCVCDVTTFVQFP